MHSCSLLQQHLNRPKVLQSFCDCFFFFRWALGLLSILRLWLIIILTLDHPALLLHLCDIQAADLQAAVLKNAILDLSIGCHSSFILHQFLYVPIDVDMCYRFLRTNWHTVSICSLCGNISTGVLLSTR